MAKQGIKVKDLARKLGVTSFKLIDRCRAEGIPVQNSLTKLQDDEEQLVRTWFSTGSDGKPAESNRGSPAGSA